MSASAKYKHIDTKSSALIVISKFSIVDSLENYKKRKNSE